MRGNKHRGRENHRFLKRILIGLLIISSGLVAQPYGDNVEIPDITPPTFDATEVAGVIDQADTAKSQSGWEALIKDMMIPVRAVWETDQQNQIDTEVATVYQDDHYHGNNEYKDFLYKSLLIQKQHGMAAWELLADLEIERYRERFVSALTDDKKREAIDESDETIEEAAARQDPVDLSTLDQEYRDWLEEFGDAMEDGQYQFHTAIGAVEEGYQNFLSTLLAKENEFETNRLKIEHYEQQVRDGIQTSVTSMGAYLKSNGLYHQETCTTIGSGTKTTQQCTTDMNTLNAAGQDLQNLVDTLQKDLDDDAPLSALAVTMNDFIVKQKGMAEQTQKDWADVITGTDWYLPAQIGAYGPGTVGDPLVAAVINARNGNGTALMNYAQGAGEPREVTGIVSADVRGTSGFYNSKWGNSGTGGYYSNEGAAAFTYDYTHKWVVPVPKGVCIPYVGCSTVWVYIEKSETRTANEEYARASSEYNWYDKNADKNAGIWQGYVNDISPVASHWTDNILPAIHNWEQQVADYTADHNQYLADASAQRAQAKQQRDDATNELVRRRNNWTSLMEEEYRQGRTAWDQIKRGNAAATRPAGPRKATRADVGTTAADYLKDIRRKRLLASAAGNANRPDFSALVEVDRAFREAATGMQNLTLVRTLSDRAFEERQAVIEQTAASMGRNSLAGLSEEQLREMAAKSAAESGQSVEEVLAAMKKNAAETQYSVEVLENGTVRAVRTIKSGKAIQTGGDGTSVDDYKAEMTDQVVDIAPPPVIELASTDKLFAGTWDHNAVTRQYFQNQEELSGSLQKYYKKMAATIDWADDVRTENERMFQSDLQGQISAATARKQSKGRLTSLLESITQAVMGGVGLETAVSDTVTQAIESSLHQIIAETTGLPVGFVGGIAAGLPPHKAAYQHFEAEAYRTFEEEVGIEGASTLLREKLAEQELNRKKRDANRGVQSLNVANQLRHNAAARGVINSTLGLFSGQALAQATGLPVDLLSPITSIEDIEGIADNIENVRRGKMSADEFKNETIDQAKAEFEAKLKEAKKQDFSALELKDLGDMAVSAMGTVVNGVVSPMYTILRPNRESGASAAFRHVAGNMLRSAGMPEGFASGIAAGQKPHEAAMSYWEAEVNAAIDHAVGVEGASGYLNEKIKEQQHARAKRDANRGLQNLNVLNQLRYNDAGRQVLDTTLGLATGQTIARATGLPVQGPLAAILPSSMDDIDNLAANVENLRRGKMDLNEFGEEFESGINEKLDEQEQRLHALSSWGTADLTGTVTNGLGGIISPVMKSLNTVVMGPNGQSSAETAFRYVASNALKKTTNIQPAFIEGLVVHGEDMETAAERGIYENLLEQYNLLELEQQMIANGMPGIESKLRERVAEWEKQNDANKAAQARPEDYLTFGATHVIRNSKYDATSAALMQAAEIGAGVAIAATGVGAPFVIGYMAYMASKQAYLGSLEGGTQGAIAGAASGVANAALAMTPMAGTNVNVGYSFEEGFTGSLGYGYDTGSGTIGGNITLAEGEGITGFGLNASIDAGSYKGVDGGVSAGMNWDIDGNFQGGNLKLTGEGGAFKGPGGSKGSFSGGLGVNFDAAGGYTGTVVEGSLNLSSRNEAKGAKFRNLGYNAGVGLTFHKEGGFDVAITQGVNMGREGSGLVGINASGTNTHSYDPRGNWKTTNQSVTTGGKYQSQDQFKQTILGLQKSRAEALAKGDTKSLEAIDQRLADIDEQLKLYDVKGAKKRDIENKLTRLYKTNPEAANALEKKLENDGELSNDDHKLLTILAGESEGGSRGEGFLSSLWGGVQDTVAWMGGRYSGDEGYIDSEGNWKQNTCFVRGTPVWTKDGAKNIEDIKEGDLVWSWNEATGRVELNQVTRTFIRKAQAIYRIKYANGQELETTWSHRFYVADRGWVKAKDLTVGNVSASANALPAPNSQRNLLQLVSFTNRTASEHSRRSSRAPPLTITGIEIQERDETVYNFAVDSAHTYFVGTPGGQWALVHNNNYKNTQEDYERWLKDEGYEFVLSASNHASSGYCRNGDCPSKQVLDYRFRKKLKEQDAELAAQKARQAEARRQAAANANNSRSGTRSSQEAGTDESSAQPAASAARPPQPEQSRLSKLWNGIKGAYNTVVNKAKEFGRETIKQVVGAYNAFKDAMSNGWESIRKFALSKLGKAFGENPLVEEVPGLREGQSLTKGTAQYEEGDYVGMAGTGVEVVLNNIGGLLKTGAKVGAAAGGFLWWKKKEKQVENVLEATERIGNLTRNPRSIWGRSAEEIAEDFRKAGYEAVVEQSTKGSKKSFQVRIKKHPDIGNIQVHPGGGRHGGAYYKISTNKEGKIKVVDPKTYKPIPGEKGTIIEME